MRDAYQLYANKIMRFMFATFFFFCHLTQSTERTKHNQANNNWSSPEGRVSAWWLMHTHMHFISTFAQCLHFLFSHSSGKKKNTSSMIYGRAQVCGCHLSPCPVLYPHRLLVAWLHLLALGSHHTVKCGPQHLYFLMVESKSTWCTHPALPLSFCGESTAEISRRYRK